MKRLFRPGKVVHSPSVDDMIHVVLGGQPRRPLAAFLSEGAVKRRLSSQKSLLPAVQHVLVLVSLLKQVFGIIVQLHIQIV